MAGMWAPASLVKPRASDLHFKRRYFPLPPCFPFKTHCISLKFLPWPSVKTQHPRLGPKGPSWHLVNTNMEFSTGLLCSQVTSGAIFLASYVHLGLHVPKCSGFPQPLLAGLSPIFN